ncbi:MAG: PIG-L family deacetylase [Bacteroidetes bacterium]|nr:PIG-L family deacetylase [Bacteroidota bacterium]
MLRIRDKKVLVLAPHTDDAELGCGGTISRLLEEGNEVYCAAFSACKQSIQKDHPEDILITELYAASQSLGIAGDKLLLFDYEVRTFNFRRQEILQDILSLREQIKPDIVFVPSINDIHQDHYTIAQEAVRVFKFSTLFSYELPWNNFEFKTTAFISLEERHVLRKTEALKHYRSQSHRQYMQPEFVKSLAVVRGVQAGVDFAEVFEIVRLIL